jgi:hypothetical protein
MALERRTDTVAGTLAGFWWAEDWTTHIDAADVIAALAGRLVGLRGVCTSWDSGMLDVASSGMTGWEMRAGQAVSPEAGLDLLCSTDTESGGVREEIVSLPLVSYSRTTGSCTTTAAF